MTFYVKRPGEAEGTPVTPPDGWVRVGSLYAADDEWSLHLPHQCDAWEIGYGSREEVLDEALKFRTELDKAIAILRKPNTALAEGN